MKKAFFFLALILSGIQMYSQGEKSGYLVDGVRFSENIYGSTARNAGIGAASSSLGGDMGSISINPAGTGVYRSSEFVFTPGLNFLTTKSTFNGSIRENTQYNFSFDNVGLLMNFKTNTSEWQGFSLAFGYNKLNDYNRNYTIQANGVNGTFANYFLNYANSNKQLPSELDDYWEGIAYDVYIIDSLGNRSYYSPFSGKKLDIRRNFNIKGSLGEYYTAFGANLNNMLYFGFSLNIRSGYYEETFDHFESNAATGENFTFSRYINSYYRAFNANLGIIFRPVENIRLGLSYHTPMIGHINSDLDSKARATTLNGTELETNTSQPEVADNDDIDISSPGRVIVGGSYMFGQLGLISADYEYTDYHKMVFSNGTYANTAETATDDAAKFLKQTHNFRLGGELKFNSLYLRGGYAFYQSPYSSSDLNKSSNTMVYSGGIGYRTSNFFTDFTYSLRTNSYYYEIASLPTATLKSNLGSYQVSIGFRF